MNWKTIWRLPVITLIGGYIGWFVLVQLLAFTWVQQPDGTMTADTTRQLLIYGLYTVLFVGITGVLFLRNLTKREIFWSATVVAFLSLLLSAVSYAIGPVTGSGGFVLLRLSMPFEWMDFPRTLIHYMTGEYTWLGSVLRAFMPYLYILFGKSN